MVLGGGEGLSPRFQLSGQMPEARTSVDVPRIDPPWWTSPVLLVCSFAYVQPSFAADGQGGVLRTAGAALALLVAGLLGGALLGFLRWGRAPRGVSLVQAAPSPPGPWSPGLPPRRQGQQVWVAPDPEARREVALALARAFAVDGQVVLVGPSDTQADLAARLGGLPGIAVPGVARPAVEPLLRTLEAMPLRDGVVLVVEGAAALEAPDPEEPEDAVVEELLDACEVPLVIVLHAGERVPGAATVRLVRGKEGLAMQDGAVVLVPTEAGLRFVSA